MPGPGVDMQAMYDDVVQYTEEVHFLAADSS